MPRSEGRGALVMEAPDILGADTGVEQLAQRDDRALAAQFLSIGTRQDRVLDVADIHYAASSMNSINSPAGPRTVHAKRPS